jgi:hypothetical protein
MTDNPLLYREVVVYRSAKKADTYLYLPAESELTDLPAELNQLFRSRHSCHGTGDYTGVENVSLEGG